MKNKLGIFLIFLLTVSCSQISEILNTPEETNITIKENSKICILWISKGSLPDLAVINGNDKLIDYQKNPKSFKSIELYTSNLRGFGINEKKFRLSLYEFNIPKDEVLIGFYYAFPATDKQKEDEKNYRYIFDLDKKGIESIAKKIPYHWSFKDKNLYRDEIKEEYGEINGSEFIQLPEVKPLVDELKLECSM